MKTLKKVLSLVLVVAMIASMLIVGAAAAEEETQYPEAAAVIKALKVMEGDERGMRYGDTVTREEAAAIICRVLLGEDAEALNIATTTAPFADVAATRWSAGYISYLKGQGIVSGKTDTEFDPTANVTGIEFAKMLLTAVGYGKAGEFEGAQWDINTITFARSAGIFEGTNAALLTNAATREECMLYAFNGLLVPTVNYNKTFEAYYTGVSAIDPAEDEELMDYTLAALKFDLQDEPTTDYFGRPAVNYYVGDYDYLAKRVVNVASSFVAENVIYGSTIYAKLGASAVAKIDRIDLWVNGGEDEGAISTAVLAKTDLTELTDQGAHIEGYITVVEEAGEKVTVLELVTYYEYIDYIGKVDEDTGISTLGYSNYAAVIPGAVVNPYQYYTYTISEIALAETYVYVVEASAVMPQTLIFEKTNADGQPVLGGKAYDLTDYATSDLGTNYGDTFMVWTDSLGNILCTANYTPSVPTNYLYLVEAHVAPANTSLSSGTDLAAKLRVVYATGGKADVNYTLGVNEFLQPTITLPAYYEGMTLIPAEEVAVTAGANMTKINGVLTEGWYTYVTAEDGSITLLERVGFVSDILGVTTAKYNVTGAYTYKATSATVLNVVNQYGVVETYTGIANFPTATKTLATMFGTDAYGNLTVINAYGENATVAPAAIPVAGYAAEYLYRDADGYHYNFAIGGAMVEVVDSRAGLEDKAYYVTLGADGYVAGASAITVDGAAEHYNEATKKYEGNLIVGVDAQYFILNQVVTSEEDYLDYLYLYYDALYMPTYVYDLANGGAAGTLSAGRAATIMVYVDSDTSVPTDCAAYIWLH